MRWLDGITDSVDVSLSKVRRQLRTGEPGMHQSMRLQRVRHDLATEQQQFIAIVYLSNKDVGVILFQT